MWMKYDREPSGGILHRPIVFKNKLSSRIELAHLQK